MRARELQANARRKWAIASVVAVVVVAAGVIGIVATTRNNSPEVTVTNTTTTTTPKSTTTHRPVVVPTTSPTTTATTTTTGHAHTPTGAISASFVSASHGWVLEKDGTIGETTDGGTTWHRVGSIGSAGDSRIRFADATRGFAFSGSESNPASSLETTDGGATWTPLAAPFSGRVYDLAISRGTVYAVTFDPAATRFRIWSSPADNLAWTEDLLQISVGAGPVPQVQLVLSGKTGWLVEVDRTVVAGAQLSPTTGHWSTWTPPCKTVNGPAFLAAWGPTDLIAACNEGVWGPPAPATAVYVSHDAGATFIRRTAPDYGPVAAADPNDAILVNGDTIRRSVDGGRTWTVIYRAPGNSSGQPLDLGFTTDSQGFVVFDNGSMLMTHDSGATWSAVTLP